jgi:PAS domain S-box-containing protein
VIIINYWIIEFSETGVKMLSNTNLFEHVDFKGIINSISDIICTIDKDFRITFWNKTVEEISGKPAGFAVNSNLLDLFPELKDSTSLLVLKDIIQTKTRQSLNKVIILMVI